MAQTLKFGNGTWATKEGSTLAYNDENENYKPLPFNFERDSIATRVNKEGLIEVVGNDIPRIDYKDSEDGVFLLEKASTNLFTYSEDFANSYWNKNSASVTLTSQIAPNGTSNSVYNLVGTSANLYVGGVTGVQHTISFYIKSNGQEKDKFKLRLGNNTSVEYTATNEWVRYEYTETPTTSVFGITTTSAPNNEFDLLVWGAQSEQSSQSSSYIPTEGTSQTRVQETASGSGNSEVFNDSEGVLFLDIQNVNATSAIPISDDSTSDFIQIYLGYTSSNPIRYRVSSGFASQFDRNFAYSLDVSQPFKISFRYSANNFSIWINGFKADEVLSGSTPIGLSTIDFYNIFGAGNKFDGKTKEIGYYDTALTDEELEYMTSYRSLNELVTELNLNTL